MICNKFIVFATVFIFGWGRFCDCQVFFGGDCLDMKRIKDIDVEKFMGEWFEYQKYPSDLEMTSKCNMLSYELKDSGDIKVLKSRYDTFSKSFVEMLGTASNVTNGRMDVQFKDAASAARSRFWILDTDYVNYSVLYTCTPITDHYHAKMVWIMTREKHPTAEAVLNAYINLAKNRLPTSDLTPIDQNGCARNSALIDKIMQLA